jgi:ubiquinone/menaquinone biosynthesis C-methylase UbiE
MSEENAMSAAATTDPMDGMRDLMQAMWTGVAPAWDAYAEDVEARGAAVTAAMLDVTGVGPGMQVLELACGAGGLGLTAAGRVGSLGGVLLTDVSEAMVAIAARRAAEAGVTNVRTAATGIEAIDVPSASFDVVVCREGLMFALDHARACGEIARVLRPGGRVAVAVWGPPSTNPWLGLVLASASAQLGEPVPPRGVPGPFALADAEELTALFRSAGLVDVEIHEVAVPLHTVSFDDWWDRCVALAGPLAQRLAALAPDDVTAMRDRARVAAEPFARDGGYDFPGVSLVAVARRP